MKKKLVGLLLFLAFLLSSCSGNEVKKKDLSGTYNIEEFLKILEPMNKAEEKVPDYATEEERSNILQEERQRILKEEIGFQGGEEIVVSGQLDFFFSTSDIVSFSLTDKKETDSVTISGDTNKVGWIGLLDENVNIKVKFKVTEGGTLQYLGFHDAEILSPSKIEYSPDCNFYSGKDAVAYGEITKIMPITMSQAEIEAAGKERNYLWYSDMKYSTHFLTIKDDKGYTAGVFVKDENNTLKVGDKIGCKGYASEAKTDDYTGAYICTSLFGCYYKFE